MIQFIFLNRDKEENWEIENEAQKLNYKNTDKLKYLGYEIGLKIEINELSENKILEINGIDVSDKNITI